MKFFIIEKTKFTIDLPQSNNTKTKQNDNTVRYCFYFLIKIGCCVFFCILQRTKKTKGEEEEKWKNGFFLKHNDQTTTDESRAREEKR